ncbi:MAG: ribonuclease HI family protein [Clostridia bacterium]|nr:ribonuclease HI family protein [Clostridia bacterium]
MGKLIIHCDGASRGNPGEAGIGYIIRNESGEVLEEASYYLGKATNNVAEYSALVRALQDCLKLGCREVEAYLDSELVVKQINGEYRVKNEGLKPLYKQAMGLLETLDKFKVKHIPRAKNKDADALANKGIDDILTD